MLAAGRVIPSATISGDADCVIATESHTTRLAFAVRDAMQQRGLTLAAIESCTGGLVASALTDVPGSGYLLGSAVAYSPEIKVRFGVPASTIADHGAVSSAVALSLAERAAAWFGTDYGIGVTGVAGPDCEEGHRPGTAFVAVWSKTRGGVVQPVSVRGDRPEVKAQTAHLAIGLLAAELDGDVETSTDAVKRWVAVTGESNDRVDHQLDDSFPASDPPSFTPVTSIGPPSDGRTSVAAR